MLGRVRFRLTVERGQLPADPVGPAQNTPAPAPGSDLLGWCSQDSGHLLLGCAGPALCSPLWILSSQKQTLGVGNFSALLPFRDEAGVPDLLPRPSGEPWRVPGASISG